MSITPAQLRADAAFALADSGAVPVWTDGVLESAGVVGVIGTAFGVDEDTGALTHEGAREVLTITPEALGALPLGATVYARPDGVGGDVAEFRVIEGPRPQPPDGVLHEVVLTRYGGAV